MVLNGVTFIQNMMKNDNKVLRFKVIDKHVVTILLESILNTCYS
jgi:hypothetical protein